MPVQATRTPAAPVMPTMNPNGTLIDTQEAEIKRRVEEEVKKLQGQLETWEIIAPVGDRNHEVWDHHDPNTGKITKRYNASEAARDGTWDIQIPAHDHYDPVTKKTTPVKKQLIPMFSGVARTADKYAALWVEREFGYVLRKVETTD